MLKLIAINFEHSFGKSLRRFLRQIVANAAFYEPVGVFAREFLGVGARVRVRRTVGIALERDGRCGDDGAFGKPPFQIIIFPLTFSPDQDAIGNCGSRWQHDQDFQKKLRYDRRWRRQSSISAKQSAI